MNQSLVDHLLELVLLHGARKSCTVALEHPLNQIGFMATDGANQSRTGYLMTDRLDGRDLFRALSFFAFSVLFFRWQFITLDIKVSSILILVSGLENLRAEIMGVINVRAVSAGYMCFRGSPLS